MLIDLITLFPEMVNGFFGESILSRAIKNDLLTVNVLNLRNWADNKHSITDDRPFGGGPGMVIKPECVFSCINDIKKDNSYVVYMCPDGEPLTNTIAKELSQKEHIIILSGHYEGIDERIRQNIVDREISIGDYVLTNGTIAAAVMIDCMSRQIKGVLGADNSLETDSFNNDLLSFPQYTRPVEFQGMRVPDVLLSGNHLQIAKWRLKEQLKRTEKKRPDLFNKYITKLEKK